MDDVEKDITQTSVFNAITYAHSSFLLLLDIIIENYVFDSSKIIL